MNDVALAHIYLTKLISLDAAQHPTQADAVEALARRLKVSGGTLEGIMRMRVKSVTYSTMQAIRRALYLSLQHQIKRLSHDLDLVSVTKDVDPSLLDQAEAALIEARKIATHLRGRP